MVQQAKKMLVSWELGTHWNLFVCIHMYVERWEGWREGRRGGREGGRAEGRRKGGREGGSEGEEREGGIVREE